MDPYAYLLAAALLSGPEINWELRKIVETQDSGDPANIQYAVMIRTAEPGNWYQYTAGEMQVLGVMWEILDPRECRHILTNPDDFFEDLRLLQKRFRDLSSAPPLADCYRLPSRDAVNQLLASNRSYREFLESRVILDRQHDKQLQAALKETDDLYHIWDTVRNARCGYYYITVRREALQQLRVLIGPNAYNSNQLPPHVPVWRIPRK